MTSAKDFRLPNLTHRTAVIGRTGSGKTVFGAWLLSLSHFDKQPYVMLDYKRDDLLNSFERAREISLKDIPKHPGLYHLSLNPWDNAEVEKWLFKIWERENIGLMFDESFMLPKSGPTDGFGALTAILTQGRSKHIPVIALTQRPKFLSRFIFTEADFHAVFHLNDSDDVTSVKRFFHSGIDLRDPIPEYHSRWYDVNKNQAFLMKPVPSPDEIRERIHSRLKPDRHLA